MMQLNSAVAATASAAGPALRAGAASASSLAALVDAHHSERRLLDDLVSIMQRQRSAVATDDLQGVDDSVFATHRVLVTLGEARRRRRTLNTMLAGSEEVGARELADAFGGHVPVALQEARDALRTAAAALAREVDVNRRVLREALASGDEYMRRLVGAGEPRPDYAPAAAPEPRAGGLLLDRRV
jgi:hypothetical protein